MTIAVDFQMESGYLQHKLFGNIKEDLTDQGYHFYFYFFQRICGNDICVDMKAARCSNTDNHCRKNNKNRNKDL